MGKRELVLSGLVLILNAGGKAGQLTVDQAVEIAVTSNKEIAAQRQLLRAAGAELVFSKPKFVHNPELEFEVESDALTSSDGNSRITVGLSQEFELGGQRNSRFALVENRFRRAKLELEIIERSVARQTRLAFYGTLIEQKLSAQWSDVESRSGRIRDSAQRRASEGIIPQSEFQFLDLDYLSIRAQQLGAEADYALAETRLALLLTNADPDTLSLVGEASDLVEEISSDSLLILNNKSHPELRRLELLEEELDQRFNLAHSNRVPNLRLGAFYSRERRTDGSNGSSNDPYLSSGRTETENLLGLRISIPLPFFNRNKAERARFQGESEAARISLKGSEGRISTVVRGAVDNLERAKALFELSSGTVPTVDSLFVLLESAYGEGRIPVERYLSQKESLQQHRFSYYRNLRALNDARIELENALGLTAPSVTLGRDDNEE
ncbi:MAG: TolC family protein [candidate division Zixibacteria bacterium]|nr:TolC family protein [candidate division Zixibacteria bacterium]